MKKFIFATIALAFLAVSCDITSIGYDSPIEKTVFEEFDAIAPNITIAGLKALYVKPGTPVQVNSNLVICGQVISSDRSGNLYKSFYIQDETGAIEIKMGKTSLYNDFKIGQWVKIKCKGLTLGQYGGMVQLGYKCEAGDYETAYFETQYLIDAHVFRGPLGTPVAPLVLDSSSLKLEENFGRFCRLENIIYANQIFVILYDDTKPSSNSTYLRNKDNYGVTTWAMSKNGFKSYMTPNGVAEPQAAFDGAITPENWQKYYNAADAYSVSQYFKFAGSSSAEIQVRTSGYAKFADTEIPENVLKGAAVNMEGILTYYNGNYQFVLLDDSDVKLVN